MASEKVIVSFRLRADLLGWLNTNADARGVTRTSFLETILEHARTEQEHAMKLTIDVDIQGPSGCFPKRLHEGTTYVETPETGKYSIILTNKSYNERRMVVLSVDGLNVLDGTPASPDGIGYVLRPRESVTVPGWRRSADEVAAFEFKRVEGSYSVQMGHGTANTGVIGLAVYDEEAPAFVGRGILRGSKPMFPVEGWPTPHRGPTLGGEEKTAGGLNFEPATKSAGSLGGVPRSRSVAETMDSMELHGSGIAERGDAAPDLGTGYGERTTMHTRVVEFKRGVLQGIIALRYGTRAKLIEWGVPLPAVRTSPNPFPAPSVPAPPGWRG